MKMVSRRGRESDGNRRRRRRKNQQPAIQYKHKYTPISLSEIKWKVQTTTINVWQGLSMRWYNNSSSSGSSNNNNNKKNEKRKNTDRKKSLYTEHKILSRTHTHTHIRPKMTELQMRIVWRFLCHYFWYISMCLCLCMVCMCAFICFDHSHLIYEYV